MNKEKLYNYNNYINDYLLLENGWWVYAGHSNVIDKEKNIHDDDKLYVNNPFVCEICGYVWTIDIGHRKNKDGYIVKNSVLLEDFPKYGLDKKPCYFCIPEKNRNN